jgi:hypothetical protein
MSATVNERFMDEQRKFAEGYPWVGGMMHVQPFKLLPHMEDLSLCHEGNSGRRFIRRALVVWSQCPRSSSRVRRHRNPRPPA